MKKLCLTLVCFALLTSTAFSSDKKQDVSKLQEQVKQLSQQLLAQKRQTLYWKKQFNALLNYSNSLEERWLNEKANKSSTFDSSGESKRGMDSNR